MYPLLISFLFATFLSGADITPAPDLEITAKLVYEPCRSLIQCGRTSVVTPLEFEVLASSIEGFMDQHICLLIPCIERYEQDFFEAQTLYMISASIRPTRTHQILHEEVLTELPLHVWAQEIRRQHVRGQRK